MSEQRRCGKCGRHGHNRRTCPGVTVRPPSVDVMTERLQLIDEAPVEARSPMQEALAEAVEAGRVKPGPASEVQLCTRSTACKKAIWRSVDGLRICSVCGGAFESREDEERVRCGCRPGAPIHDLGAEGCGYVGPAAVERCPRSPACVRAGWSTYSVSPDLVVAICGHCGGRGARDSLVATMEQARPEPPAEQQLQLEDDPDAPLRTTQDGRLVPADEVIPPWSSVLEGAAPIRIVLPGVYQLTAEEYHADPVAGESLSNSGGRLLIAPSAPRKYREQKDRPDAREQKDSFDRGRVMHELVLGDGAGIVVIPHSTFRTAESRRMRAEARAAGKAPILERDMPEAERMAAAFLEHEFAVSLLTQPGKSEQTLIWLDEQTGVMERALVDYLPDPVPLDSPNRMIIPDYKTTIEAFPGDKMSRHLYDYGYHRQAAKYRKGVLSLGLAPEAVMVFLFQEKTPPFLVTPVFLDRNAMIIGTEDNRRALDVYAECMETGVWPGYSDEPVEMSLPVFIERKYGDLIG